MPKVVPGTEVNLPEVAEVRISTAVRWPGRILAVRLPLWGWVTYKSWGVIKLIPEERIMPAVLVGVSTFTIAKLTMESLSLIVKAPFQEDFLGGLLRGLPLFGPAFSLFKPVVPLIEKQLGPSFLEDHPLPFYIGVMAASLTIAGLDPGMALRAFAELLNAITPFT